MKTISARTLIFKVAISCAWLAPTIHAAEAQWGAKYFPNYTVTAHSGKKFRFYDDLIKGRIVIINFIYTTCTDICGLQTARMALIQDRLAERLGKDLFIYSISLDPERDTPDVLKDYASAFSPRSGWLFLTGNPAEVHQIRFKLGERSRKLSEHQNYAVLGNGRTGTWSRTSMMKDIQLFVKEVLELDPNYRGTTRTVAGKTRPDQRRRARQLKSQTGQALFVKACAACHTIGGGVRVGPDLVDVTERRRLDWLKQYISRPTRMRAENDPIALALRQQYKNVLMPYLGLSETDASDLLSYIRAQSLNWKKSGKGTTSAVR